MFRRVILVICLTAVLGLVASASGATYLWNWTAGDDSWCLPGNWSPSGVPGVTNPSVDTATISPGDGPTIPPGCEPNVSSITGPDPGSGSANIDITGGKLIVQNDWALSRSGTGTRTISITGNSVVKVLGTGHMFLGPDRGTGIFNMSGDPNVFFGGGASTGDKSGGQGFINIHGGRLRARNLGFGHDCDYGQMNVSGEKTEIHLTENLGFYCRQPESAIDFNMAGGLIDIGTTWIMGAQEDEDFTSPDAIQIDFDGGTIICNDFTMYATGDHPNGIPFKMDFEEGAVLEIRQDRYVRMRTWIDLGYITGKDDTVDPDVVIIGGHTFVGFDLYQEEASNPSPYTGTGGICPNGLTLTWEAGDKADQHKVFFGPNWADVNNMTDPCATKNLGNETYKTGWLEYGKTYYWRVDEVNLTDPCTWRGTVWNFSTPSGKATNPDPFDGQRGAPSLSGTIDLSWTLPCFLKGQTLYYGTTFPVDGTWSQVELGTTDSNYLLPVDRFEQYYWRVDTNDGNNVIQGDDWDFTTGFGGLLMYYKFDGTQGNNLPSPITDDSGNNIQFWKYDGGGSLTYGESNPVVAASTASADFEPNAALYRLDPCEPNGWDLLRLDGSEYTVELWVKPESWTGGNIWLLYKDQSWSLAIMSLSDCGGYCDESYRWYSGGSQTALTDDQTAVLGEWVHLAVVRDEGGDLGGIFLNGVRQEEEDGSGGQNPPDNNSPVWIGVKRLPDGSFEGGFYDGLMDEIRIHDVALRPCELLAFQVAPEYASCPTPYDGESEIDPCTVLMWKPGEGAVSHDIYFSSNYLDVVAGSPVETGWGPSSWTPTTLPLDDGTVYYWRVDTYDDGGPPYEGQVWQFTTEYVITDPTLLLHYKLDESFGDTATDASGHGRHGDVANEDNWDPDGGHFGGCLIFDDDQRIDVPSATTLAIADEISVTVWLYGYKQTLGARDNWVLQISGDYSVDVIVPDENRDVYWRAGNDSNDALVWNDATPAAWIGDWHFFAFVKDESADFMKIYFDGLEVKSKSGTIGSLAGVRGRPFDIGAKLGHTSDYEGKMDDIRVYNKALSAKEVGELFRGGDLERAWAPDPYDGQPDAAFNTDLSWQPGDYAASHDVYFGTNWDEVSDANSSIHHNVDYNNVADTNYDVGILELDKTYYWRVDEVNDACDPNGWRGYIWRFKVADYVVIDDMEDYTENYNEYPITTIQHQNYGWDSSIHNKTGADLFLSCAECQYSQLYHGGDKAMYYYYDITWDWGCGDPGEQDCFYAEISNHFSMDPCDWEVLGLKMLSLWFYGESDNASTGVEQMYVGLEDSSGSGSYSEVRYGDGEGEDVNDITIEEWQQWNIPLSDFTSVDLSRVEKIYIGFGERYGGIAGGAGTVLFDDIRVYPPTCILSERPTEFVKLDLYPDCIVDFGDVSLIADDWLESDVNLGEVTEPSDTNLVGWWELDEGTGSDAYDSSGNNFNGVIETIDNDVWWVEGVNDVNHALDFEGGRVLVSDAPELRPLHQVSVSAWIKVFDEQSTNARIVVKGADNKETFGLELGDQGTVGFKVRDGNDPNAGSYPMYATSSSQEVAYDEWTHVAGTFDGDSVKVYVKGELGGTNNDANAVIILSQDTSGLAIGNRSDDADRAFEGIIDDVRVYNYGLSAKEIVYLATDGTGIVALESVADLHKDPRGQGAINFKDLAELGAAWFDEELWPQ